jgi:hypothetical protein
VVAEAFATIMPRGATGVLHAGALVLPKPGRSELLVQDELVLAEQLAFLVVRGFRGVASGGAIGASGGAMAECSGVTVP